MVNKNDQTKVITGKVRFAYLHVFEPHAVEETQEKKYSATLLIPKSDTNTINDIERAIKNAVDQGIKEKWGGKKPANLKIPLRDGDLERPDHPEFHGHYFVNAKSTFKPGVVDAQLNEIIDSTEIYSGCYGRASINFYAYNVSGNKGIACGLNNIQKLHDGETLGGRARPEDEFSAVDVSEFEENNTDVDDFLA